MNDDLTTRMIRIQSPVRMEEAYLIVVRAPDLDEENRPGTAYKLGGITKIGRLRTNDIVLQGDSVSREHCWIERRTDGFHLIDEGSANGTIVSGKRVRDGQLHRQERLQMGDYTFVFWEGLLEDETLLAWLHDAGVGAVVRGGVF